MKQTYQKLYINILRFGSVGRGSETDDERSIENALECGDGGEGKVNTSRRQATSGSEADPHLHVTFLPGFHNRSPSTYFAYHLIRQIVRARDSWNRWNSRISHVYLFLWCSPVANVSGPVLWQKFIVWNEYKNRSLKILLFVLPEKNRTFSKIYGRCFQLRILSIIIYII